MIELFTIVVRTQMMFGWHWCCEAFAVLHTELLQAIFEIFLLRYEDAVALLSYLKTEEELQLPHHGHLILLLHHISKLFTVLLIGAAEGEHPSLALKKRSRGKLVMLDVLEICPRGNNKSIIIIFPCS